MTTILNGLLGGLVIGFIAAIVTRFIGDGPSATAAVFESVLGPGAVSERWVGFFIRVVYGSLAGGTLVALELSVLGILSVPPSIVAAFGVAVVWSALLFATLSVIRRVVTPRSLTGSRLGGSLVYHLVYGLGFGLWIRMTWIT